MVMTGRLSVKNQRINNNHEGQVLARIRPQILEAINRREVAKNYQ